VKRKIKTGVSVLLAMLIVLTSAILPGGFVPRTYAEEVSGETGETVVTEVAFDRQVYDVMVGTPLASQLILKYSDGHEEPAGSRATYRTSDDSIVIVDEAGLLTPLKEGQTTLTATYPGFDPVSVQVNVVAQSESKVESVRFDRSAYDVVLGAPLVSQLMLQYSDGHEEPAGDRATYSSSDENIFTVDEKGLLIPNQAGEATLTATYPGFDPVTVPVKVVAQSENKVVGVYLDRPVYDVVLGIPLQSQFMLTYSDGHAEPAGSRAMYRSSDDSIFTVDEVGLLTPHKEGQATLTATYPGFDPVTAQVNVVQPVLTDLYTENSYYPVNINKTQKIRAFAVYNNNYNYPVEVTDKATFASANTEIATVDEHGVITGVREGYTTIAVSYLGKTKKVEVSVYPSYLMGIEPNQPSFWIEAGKSEKLQVSAHYSDGEIKDITAEAVYDSSNPMVASVDPDGTIKAKTSGSTNIAITYKGRVATVNVQVGPSATQPPMYVQAFMDMYSKKYIDILFDKNIVSNLDNIAQGITISGDGVTFKPLAEEDDVHIFDRNLNIKLRAPLYGSAPKIKIAANTLKSEEGTVLSEDVVIDLLKSTPQVQVTVDEVRSINSKEGFIGDIHIKESAPDALKMGQGSLRLKLPAGFKWEYTGNVIPVWSAQSNGYPVNNGVTISLEDNGRTLVINKEWDPWNPNNFQEREYYILSNARIVAQDTDAPVGEIQATISGNSVTDTNQLVLATYEDVKTKVSVQAEPVGSVPAILAGRSTQSTGKLKITIPDVPSLENGSFITVRLPENARWSMDGYQPFPTSTQDSVMDLVNSELNGLGIQWMYDGERTLKGQIWKGSYPGYENTGENTTATIVLHPLKVAVAPNFKGDFAVTVGGNVVSEPVTASIATVKPLVTMQTSVVPHVVIGNDKQSVGDIIISESAAGALRENEELHFLLPYGVEFSTAPRVEVIEGDLKLEPSVTVGDYYGNYAVLKVRYDSTKPSKIKLSGLQLRIDRTVPNGDIVLKLNSNEPNMYPFSTISSLTIAKVTDVLPQPAVLNSISLDQAQYSLAAGAKHQLVVTAAYNDNTVRTITGSAQYTFSNPAVVTVDSTGKMTGVAQGTATITVTYSGKTATATVNVTTGSPSNRVKGDVNGSGTVDVADVVKTVNIVLETVTPTAEEREAANMNDDGAVNIFDVIQIVNLIVGRK
jgi:uncharacterized protein YjdB